MCDGICVGLFVEAYLYVYLYNYLEVYTGSEMVFCVVRSGAYIQYQSKTRLFLIY